jgi:hypothetical protein
LFSLFFIGKTTGEDHVNATSSFVSIQRRAPQDRGL